MFASFELITHHLLNPGHSSDEVLETGKSTGFSISRFGKNEETNLFNHRLKPKGRSPSLEGRGNWLLISQINIARIAIAAQVTPRLSVTNPQINILNLSGIVNSVTQ